MYTFILMLSDFFRTGRMHWYILFILFILIRWILVSIYAFRYKPFRCENKPFFTSVIIPVIDEPAAILEQVISRIADQKPDEIIVVINGPDSRKVYNEYLALQQKPQAEDPSGGSPVRLVRTNVSGKRHAISLGIRKTDPRSDITILVDSDSIWTEGTLENLLMPFSADETIGGVTTRQKIFSPNRSLTTMISALMEEIRAEGTMKAMSVTEKVGCLPGRTIAFRTSILRKARREFLTETFMGIHKEVSDDRSLTNITLKMGYKTVMQDTAVVFTDAPVRWKKFLRQQLRWAEGSQYNNLRMSGWMFRNAKLMFYLYWGDILMPFLLAGTWGSICLCTIFRSLGLMPHTFTYMQPWWQTLLLIFAGIIVGVGGRNYRALQYLPFFYVLILPFLMIILTFVLPPIRLLGLMLCADNLDWGTRKVRT